MKLELKHLAPYLQHNLKCQVTDKRKRKIATLGGLYNDGNCVFHDTIESEKGFKRIKPLLLPLSALYEEIDGEIGIEKIGKLYEPNGKLLYDDGKYSFGWNTHVCDDYQGYEIGWYRKQCWFGIYFDAYDFVNQEENFTGDFIPFNIEAANYLDEKHYDWRYGLIDKGIAIDKRTV